LTCKRPVLTGNLSNDCDEILSVHAVNMVAVVVIILVATKTITATNKQTNKQTMLSLSQAVRVFAVVITKSNMSDVYD